MPVIHVYMWSGVSREAKIRIVKGVTKVFEDLGVPPHAVEVIIQEIPKEDWGVAGVPASEKLKDLKPP